MNHQRTKFFSANLTYFIIIVGFVLIRILSAVGALSFLGEATSYTLNLILQIGLMFLLPTFFYSSLIKEKPKNVLKSFGFKKIKLNAILIAILMGIIIFFLNIGISSFFNFIINLFGYEKTPTVTESYPVYMLFVNLFFTAVLPSICEEITHRGMLINGYNTLGFKKAILISSLLFGLTHLNIEQFFYATIVGLFLALITMICGNIIPAIIIHFVNNAINVTISFLIVNNKAFAEGYNAVFNSLLSGNFFAVITTMFVLITILVLILGYLLYALFKETAIANLNKVADDITKKQLRAELMEDEDLIQNEIKHDEIPVQVERGNRVFKIYVPVESIGYPMKQIYFPSLKEKLFLIGSIILATLVTISTFIWGTL